MAEYIDREEYCEKHCRCSNEYCDKESCPIWKAPAADVAPVVHGHFVHDGPRFAGGVDWWHCSSCGKLASGVEIRFDYCPWCGARMDGDAERRNT